MFKGDLTYEDIMHNIPFKRLLDMRDARTARLIREREEEEKRIAEQAKQDRKNMIMQR